MPAKLDIRPAHAPLAPAALTRGGWYGPCRTAAEFVLALALSLPALPVLLVVTALVRLTSRGPALYRQTSLGLNGRPFTLIKVRSMVHDGERHGGAQWSCPGDPRVTRLGAFLRKTHLDELPQLWNVLKGEMSLIGPRPERPEFV